ncbi:urea ABC transporter ATP-binding protein UrtD [Aurantimonas sp. HBX-1]|uniref:urea ABC transporter ATP-binding protein UrtD n=1 Tax=Aurantimonas sp. HBX-1 TaxID=2906072 RepID=UPI001F250B09|nr:urea ABC transporter ATP-binding protein UrtD [Aurantimonas sp. HBX-1]UIJ72287.1 urea ABC transporter ATP-binding protein UrtD [Aurantimonas sp. HBX-1]
MNMIEPTPQATPAAVSPHPYASARRDEALRNPPGAARRETLLYLDGVNKSFDGFKAINNLSLVLVRGEMRAIIGPNGAGKTTMMDIITGKTKPDSGEVYFNGDVDLTRHDEAAIAGMGIGRKFQKPTVFEGHTVEDNLRLSLAGPRSIFSALVHRTDDGERAAIARILDTTRLSAKRRTLAADLSHGQKQWLEIGMLLAQDPELLLVDEPVAGMTDAETEETARLLREIAETRSVVVVEHDMHFVRDLAVKVTCLHEGAVLSEGTLDHVSKDPRVIEVYLGR